MYKYRFTICTACYNGAHIIHRVVDCLRAQSFRDFEWIVIDDCSTDNLYSIIEPLIFEKEFPVKYFRQEINKGLTSALNLGVENSEGEFFLQLDADDNILNDTLEIFNDTYDSLPENIKSEINGVVGLCQDEYGNIVGSLFPTTGNDIISPHNIRNDVPLLLCDVFDMRYKYKVRGEKCGFTKTDIMKEFPFRTDIGDVTEDTVWFAIANKYKSIFINKVVRTYWTPVKTSMSYRKNPAITERFYYEEVINKYIKKMHLNPFALSIIYAKYIKHSLVLNDNIFSAIKKLNAPYKRLLAYICIPLGYLGYLIKR